MWTAAAVEGTLARTTNKLEVFGDKSVIGGPIVAALGINQPHALDAVLPGVVADAIKLADLPATTPSVRPQPDESEQRAGRKRCKSGGLVSHGKRSRLTNSSSATGRAKTSSEEQKEPHRPACSLERVVRRCGRPAREALSKTKRCRADRRRRSTHAPD